MRAKWLGEEPRDAMYWLRCPKCDEELKVSAFAYPPPHYDLGERNPVVRCPFCRAEPHVPGPRDRALDQGLPDPGVRETIDHALVGALADQARRERRR